MINQEGGANTLTDVMMLCSRLEAEAIKTVLILNEFAGHDGTTPSLAETTREAEHIVSTGNNDYLLHLPPSERSVGSDTFPGVEGSITGPIALPLTRIHSSTNQLGFGRLSCGSDAAPPDPPSQNREALAGRALLEPVLRANRRRRQGQCRPCRRKPGRSGRGWPSKSSSARTHEVIATVICGDNTMAENLDQAAEAAAELIADYRPDLLVAGPCFNAGRYGMACGAVCKAVAESDGYPDRHGDCRDQPCGRGLS